MEEENPITFEVIELEQLCNVTGGMGLTLSMDDNSSCVSQCHVDGNNEEGTS